MDIKMEVKWRTINSSIGVIPICIGSSIWMIKHREYAVAQYIPGSASNTIAVTPYKDKFTRNWNISCCRYGEHSIVLIDTEDRIVVVFDTAKTIFSEKLSLPDSQRIQRYPPWCFTFGDYVHFGNDDEEQNYAILSIVDGTVRFFANDFCGSPRNMPQPKTIQMDQQFRDSTDTLISGFSRQYIGNGIPVAVVRLILTFHLPDVVKFDGEIELEGIKVSRGADVRVYVGKLRNNNAAQPVEWTLVPEYEMKRRLRFFGCINHGPFIITFGGLLVKYPGKTDEIYMLDTTKNDGWIKSPIRCPEARAYHATLDDNGIVHLLSRFEPIEHHCIELKDVIP